MAAKLPKDARATAGLYRDSQTNRVSLHTRVQWTQPIWFGSLSSVVETTRDDAETRNGRTGFEWRAARKDGGLVKGGAFLLEPMRFSNRSANVGLPSVALRGFQTSFAKGQTTIGAFTGSVIVDEGLRGWRTRKTPDKIRGVHVSRSISKDFAIAAEADRVSSGVSAQTILRPSFRWNLSRATVLNGEYSAAKGGSPSLRSSPQASPTATNGQTFLVEYQKAFH